MSDTYAPSRFAISLGTHRGRARNDEWTAKKLWDRINKPLVDTEISWAKYLALKPDSKEDQSLKSRLKAKPGWFKMGHYKDGRRKHENLLGVSAISLDLDSVSVDQVDYIRMGLAPISEFTWIGHTTRSHTPEKPRWRLIIFLNRMVNLDEANAIARYLATMLADDPQEGIEMADQVSFRNNQAMYWPSICDGQPFETDRNTAGKLLDVDEFLGRHPNWTDVSTLPRQEHEKHAHGADPHKKFEDPRDKPGVIGAFCRAYDIESAIAEFIPDIYTPGDSSGSDIRYTYAPGSAYNGVIVYDDGQVIYSNHGTDPIQGGANAWDMVRIHKFGHLDAKADEGTSPMKLPSHKAMLDLIRNDKAVKAEMLEGARDKFDEADDEDDEEGEGKDDRFDEDDDDFLGLGDDDDDVDDLLGLSEKPAERKKDKPKKWKADLRVNMETGTLIKSSHNVSLILQNDPPFKKRIAYNEFSRKIVAIQPLDLPDLTTLARIPVSAEDAKVHGGREWCDTDENDIRCALAAPQDLGGWEYDVPMLDVRAAVDLASRQNPIHPLRERVSSFVWDGHARAETLWIDFLGVEDNAYHREACRLWLLASIVRLFEPGHKWDHVPIFGGRQGIGKSTFLKALALGYAGALHPNVSDLGRMVESMLGFWIMEIGELTTLSKADSEEVKHFLTETHDTYRLAYRHNAETFPRACTIAGTTNHDQYLKDETGNRRFWPVVCKVESIDVEALGRLAPQIWAEVLTWYQAARQAQPGGTLPLFLRDPEARKIASGLQDAARKVSPAEIMAEEISEWLNRPRDLASVTEGGDDRFDRENAGEGVMVRRTRATINELWIDALGQDRKMTHTDTTTLGIAMTMIPGWTKGRRMIAYQRTTWLTRDGAPWEETAWEPIEPPE